MSKIPYIPRLWAGWVTADGGRSAQYEHTMAVTETGLDVLTKRTANSRPFY